MRGNFFKEAEAAKYAAWQFALDVAIGGRLILACVESQGRLGPKLVSEMYRLAQCYARRNSPGTPFVEATLLAAVLGRWRRRLSVALQCGNARILRACLGACRKVGAEVSPVAVLTA